MTKATVKAVPLQVIEVWFGINGFGLTVTIMVKVLLQVLGDAPDVAVTV